MKLTTKDIVIGCLERIGVLQEHVRRVNDALIYINMIDSFAKVDAGDIIIRLTMSENNEWRKLSMWALTLDGADQDRIKAAVHQRFLRDGMSVADWINGGVTPGWWLQSDEEEFRAMAKKAFAPKEEA